MEGFICLFPLFTLHFSLSSGDHPGYNLLRTSMTYGSSKMTGLRIALAYPRVTLNLRPAAARANLFSGD